MLRRPHQTRDHTSIEYHLLRTRYQVLYSSSTYCCRCSLQQAPRSHSYKEKRDAVRIEPPPPSASPYRHWARSSRTLWRPQASGDGTRMPSVLGESRASCWLSSWARSNSGSQQHQYEYRYIRAASQSSSTTSYS